MIGPIRRECIDHVVVFGERHLRHVLLSYKDYYNATRTFCAIRPRYRCHELVVVPTNGFGLLYAFVIVRLRRRDIVWVNVTANPTAEWVARQLTEAFPWDEAPRYLIRDRDRIYGTVVTRRLRAMGIRDKPIAPASPWQNGVVERLIGSIRRERVDHIIILGRHICAGF